MKAAGPGAPMRSVGESEAPLWAKGFLAALRETGIVRRACKAADVARSTVYAHRTQSAEFSASWTEALEDAADKVEAEALRRAVEGDRMPVLHNGRPVFVWFDADGEIVPEGTEGAHRKALMRTSRSDVLLIFTLKALRPERFRDRFDVRTTQAEQELDEEIIRLAKELGLQA